MDLHCVIVDEQYSGKLLLELPCLCLLSFMIATPMSKLSSSNLTHHLYLWFILLKTVEGNYRNFALKDDDNIQHKSNI